MPGLTPTCEHGISEQDTATIVDGLCPLCQAAEIEALKHDIERHLSITSEQAAEIERLRAALGE